MYNVVSLSLTLPPQLARQGFNIVIMSRSEEKLRSVENEISNKLLDVCVCSDSLCIAGSQYNRDVRVIPVDFTQGQSVYSDIQAEISDLDIGILGKDYNDTLI